MPTAPCPTCGKRVDLDSATEAPFCSERCRLVDLGRWLDERHGIPVEPGEGDTEERQEESPPEGNGNL